MTPQEYWSNIKEDNRQTSYKKLHTVIDHPANKKKLKFYLERRQILLCNLYQLKLEQNY